MKLGAAIRKTRVDLGLKLEAVAMEAGFDAGNLSRIETGKQNPSMDRLEDIARALGVSVADLYLAAENESRTGNALRDSGDSAAYGQEMLAVRRGYTTLDSRHRKMALEFIKMLNRLQREEKAG